MFKSKVGARAGSRELWAAVLSVGLCSGLLACGAGVASPAATPEGSLAAEALSSKPPELKGVPDTAAGQQLAWVLQLINVSKGQVELAVIESHFAPAFLKAVAPAQLQSVLAGLAAQSAPLAVLDVERNEPDALVVVVSTAAAPLRVSLRLATDSGQITGLLFAPAPDQAAERPQSWAAVAEQVSALAPRSQYLVAELSGAGSCTTLQASNSSERLALGSTFKLYVLAALVEQIRAGKLKWDGVLRVSDKLKSLPSGRLQNAPEGTQLSLREAAELMISISDNTATDHLIDTLGRQSVEAALAASGHGKPALNVPLLSTRELFLFKLDHTEEQIADYLQLDASGRRGYLQSLAERTPSVANAKDWTTPRHIDELEWFGSAEDLCAVMAQLQQSSEQPKLAPLLAVLGKNPGLPRNEANFPYLGFKGGSEPGVLNLTWLTRSSDGRWFVVVLGFNHPDGKVDMSKAVVIASGIFSLLAQQ